jgi:hypothetical protein
MLPRLAMPPRLARLAEEVASYVCGSGGDLRLPLSRPLLRTHLSPFTKDVRGGGSLKGF